MLNFSILLVLLIFSNYAGAVENVTDESGNVIYSTTKHPFGDEQQFNINSVDGDTNQVHCVEQKDLKKLEGSCPLNQSTPEVTDPYIACLGYDVIPPPHEPLYSSNERPIPEVQCKRCDLRLTPDNSAVIVECFQCYDIPSANKEASRIEKISFIKSITWQ